MDVKEAIPIAFVAFHAFFNDQVIKNIKIEFKKYESYKQIELLDVMFKSARMFHPGCKCIVLSDYKTEFKSNPDYHILRFDLDLNQLQLTMIKERIEFLKQSDNSSHIIFLDTDMLIQQNLDDVFYSDFDIALTYRPPIVKIPHKSGKNIVTLGKQTPINGGIYFVHRDHLSHAIKFFEILHKLYLEKSPKYKLKTWNIEYILPKMFGGVMNLVKMPKGIYYSQGIRVKFLSCDFYNYSSLGRDMPMDEFYPDKKILHFKGIRKKYMIPYFEQFIKPSQEQT